MGYRLQKSGSQIDAILMHSVVFLEGSFSSLSALQEAFPSGDAGLYKIEDKWYYWDTDNLAWTEGGDVDPNMIVKGQVMIAIIATTLQNINGKTLSSFESNEVTIGGYPVYKITRGGNNLTQDDAALYMKYMCGSEYVPTYNYDFPRNTIFLLPNGQLLKPQFDSTNGLLLYKMSTIVPASRTIAGLPLSSDISVSSLLNALFTITEHSGEWEE